MPPGRASQVRRLHRPAGDRATGPRPGRLVGAGRAAGAGSVRAGRPAAPSNLVTTAGANATAYTWTGASPGTTYSFYVTAYNAIGESAPSNAAVVTPPAA